MVRHRRRVLAAIIAGPLAASLAAAPAQATITPAQAEIVVPGAERQEVARLADLTTAGTVASGHTDPADWAGLHAPGTVNPTGVPGIQIDGFFPDRSSFNNEHGWHHDAQFVIRLPDHWTGGLVITGAPGVRKQYANDFIISDWVLARGYAFASTDKGNSGTTFYRDGVQPGDAILEWHRRVTQLAIAAKIVVRQRYGTAPSRTLMTGVSNGGAATRAAAHAEMIAAGYAPGSEPTWDFHYRVYWDLTQRIYREELDPDYDGALEAGTPFCAPGSVPGCDTDYDYASRPASVHRAMDRVSRNGRIGKPLLALQGTLDSLLPIGLDSDVYAGMVRDQGRGDLLRYYRIEGGAHVDGLYALFPTVVRPVLPCYRSAFAALERWLDGTALPPPDATVPRPASGDVVNSCALAATG